LNDSCTIISGGLEKDDTSAKSGRHSDRLAYMMERQLVPKDRQRIIKMLEPEYILERLKQEDPYSLSYSILGEAGEIQTKKLTVSATDLRLGRVCLARADITDSVREQQGLLNVVAFCMIIYMLSFFTISPDGIRLVSLSMVEFFQGAIIPLPFFPDAVRKVMELLPFAAMQNVALRVYSGDLAGAALQRAVILQIFWFFAMLACGKALEYRAMKKIVVQGG